MVSTTRQTPNTIPIPVHRPTPTPINVPPPMNPTTTKSSPYFTNAQTTAPHIPYNNTVHRPNIPPPSTLRPPPPIPSRTTVAAPPTRSQIPIPQQQQRPVIPPPTTSIHVLRNRPQAVIPVPGGTIPTIQRPQPRPLPSQQPPKNPFYRPRQ